MEVVKMAFKIKPNRRESENKTIRFPLEVIDRINEAITGKDVSFSNFVIQAVEYALDNMENQTKN
jgi:predicted DNA-binding protein